jgi:hypothetical protein
VGLDNDQKELVDACTSAEVLKLSLLNSFDAIRQLLITDFSKSPKIYEDEAIELRVLPSPGGRRAADVRSPKRVPYSIVGSMGDFTVHWQDGKNMIIGPDADAGELYDLAWTLPRTSVTIRMRNVPAGKIYLVARVEGDPAPVTPEKKRDILGIPLTSKGTLDQKLGDLADPPPGDPRYSRRFDIDDVVARNLRIPSPAMGFVESIYRTIRMRPAIQPPNLAPTSLSNELKQIKLETFRTYFRLLTEKTTTATGDITTFDVADSLFFGGLAWVSSLLGISRPPDSSSPTAPGAAGAAAGTAGTPGAAGSAPAGSGGRSGAATSHSLGTLLSDPMIAAGSTPAERAANRDNIMRSINQAELRKALNRVSVTPVLFTEGDVDKWCRLAGLREGK